MRGGSFTESVVAELAPHLPPLPHCRAALLEGMSLTGEPAPPGAVETPASVGRSLRGGHPARGRASGPRLTRTRTPPGPLSRRCAGGRSAADGRQLLSRAACGAHSWRSGSVNGPDRAPHLEIPVRDFRAAAALLVETSSSWRSLRRCACAGRPVVTVRTASAVGAALSSIGAQGGRLHSSRAGSSAMSRRRQPQPERRDGQPAPHRRRRGASARCRGAPARRRRAMGSLPPARARRGELRLTTRRLTGTLAEQAGISRPAMAGRLHRLVEAAARLSVARLRGTRW